MGTTVHEDPNKEFMIKMKKMKIKPRIVMAATRPPENVHPLLF
jgi:hypothetical protein